MTTVSGGNNERARMERRGGRSKSGAGRGGADWRTATATHSVACGLSLCCTRPCSVSLCGRCSAVLSTAVPCSARGSRQALLTMHCTALHAHITRSTGCAANMRRAHSRARAGRAPSGRTHASGRSASGLSRFRAQSRPTARPTRRPECHSAIAERPLRVLRVRGAQAFGTRGLRRRS